MFDLVLYSLCAIGLFVVLKFGRWIRLLYRLYKLGEGAAACSDLEQPLFPLNLTPLHAESNKAQRLDHRIEQFESAGFELRGVHEIEDAPCLSLALFVREQDGLIGCASATENTGTWLDLYRYGPEKEELDLVSGVYDAWLYLFLPGLQRVHKPGAPLEEMLKMFDGRPVSTAPWAWSEEELKKRLTSAYETHLERFAVDQADPVNLRVMARKHLEKMPGCDCEDDEDPVLSEQKTESQLRDYIAYVRKTLLRKMIVRRLRFDGVVDAVTWHEAGSALLVVHERDDSNSLKANWWLDAHMMLNEKERKDLCRAIGKTGESVQRAFRDWNASRRGTEQYVLLGEVEGPVAGAVYYKPKPV